MKTAVECLHCFLNQAIRTTALLECSVEVRFRIVRETAAVIAGMERDRSPVANSGALYDKISELSGCNDPYLQLKQRSTNEALAHLPELKAELARSGNPLGQAVRFAIAGNIIDYGSQSGFDLQKALRRSRMDRMAVDDIPVLEQRLRSMKRGDSILYLADNCGEIIYDTLLVNCLYGAGFNITVAVKEGPIINDALVEDAIQAGLEKYGAIISNGTNLPGTVLEKCSTAFRKIFREADLVISKGQGNFESLSGEDRDIFFLLTAKCPVAAAHLAELSGAPAELLPGRGEMAVFHYKGKRSDGD
jgi:uncharacterized protein with ATP-grasp and redox domains